MARLGVNIDHVATLREVRKGVEPRPYLAAVICEKAGADSIVVHLREDRRHIKEKDLYRLSKTVKTRLNLEMSTYDDILTIACRLRPDRATLVPERREELTTEGGLDAVSNFKKIERAASKLKVNGIEISLFIDPVKKQIDATRKLGIEMIELHTGKYANAKNASEQERFLKEIKIAVDYARNLGLQVFAGHGLDYDNIKKIAKIKEIEEFNIGYSIVCRAVLVGLGQAVEEMKSLVR